MNGILTSVSRWLVRRPGYMLLVGPDEALAQEPPQRFRNAWVGVMLLSIAWGIVSAGLWRTALNAKTYTTIPFVPVAVVVVPMLLWLYRRCAGSLSRLVCGQQAADQAVGAGVIVGVVVLALLELKWPDRLGSPQELPEAWKWLWPEILYRALIVAPVWGGWAMLITCQFCRCREQTEPAVVAFARGCGPLAAAVCLAPPLTATLVYFDFLGWARVMLAGVTALAALGGGLAFCRLSGGLRRQALLAVNLLTQIVFLLGYLMTR
jgi:hypothetical protein